MLDWQGKPKTKTYKLSLREDIAQARQKQVRAVSHKPAGGER
jgi:hypothetical protein